MGNSAGVLAVLAAVVKPGLVVPHVQIGDISELDWQALRGAGVRHVVIDKDNCITAPLEDNVFPELVPAWDRLASAGFDSILVVSNSAGSSDDPLAIGAEHLARTLGQRVLAHPAKKPAMACARQVVDVLADEQGQSSASASSSSSLGHVAVIGDRITTDIVLANRMQKALSQRRAGSLSARIASIVRMSRQASTSSSSAASQVVGILTTRVLRPERFGTRTLRALEMWVLQRLCAIGVTPDGSWLSRQRGPSQSGSIDWQAVAARAEASARTEIEHASNPEIEDADRAAAVAAQEAHAQLPLSQRFRMLPTLAMQRIGGASIRAGLWLGQGWCLIQDGIRLGTKGRIGAPDGNRMRHSRLVGPAHGFSAGEASAMHMRDGWPGTSQMFQRQALGVESHSRAPRLGTPASVNAQRRPLSTSCRRRAKATGPTGPSMADYGAFSPQRIRNIVSGVAALVILPTFFYAGSELASYLKPDVDEDDPEEAHVPKELHPRSVDGKLSDDDTARLSSRAMSSPFEGLTRWMEGTPSINTLYARRLSVQEDLERIDDKLAEIRQRIRVRDAEKNGGKIEPSKKKQKKQAMKEAKYGEYGWIMEAPESGPRLV